MLLKKCIEWDNPLKLTKYMLREVLIQSTGLENAEGRALHAAPDMATLADMFGVSAEHAEFEERHRQALLKRAAPAPADEAEGEDDGKRSAPAVSEEEGPGDR
jgi:hypothetical protein